MHPLAIRRCDPERQLIELVVSRSEIERGPVVDADRPLSARRAEQYYRHFGWPAYWSSLSNGFSGNANLPSVHEPSGQRS